MSDGKQTVERLREAFPEAVVSVGEFRDQHWATVDVAQLVEICRWLRDDASQAFDYLVDVTAVHWPDEEEPVELVYHFYSYGNDVRLRLKVRVGEGQAVPSLSALWKSADWNERETYDMFGIEFEGHPDLRRILMPDDYTDFPLRKEFPLYRG